MSAKDHWEAIYQTKAPTEVSWYQAQAQLSLDLIRRAANQPHEPILDVGGGASTLVDGLLDGGFQAVTVLDISAAALRAARQRLGARAERVIWLEADLTEMTWPAPSYAVWHDRAVFHFLTDPPARQRYVASLRQAVRPGGAVIMATFALDGPSRCSGLDVVRYSPASLQRELGDAFDLIDSVAETHHTPSGAEQKFMYGCYRRN